MKTTPIRDQRFPGDPLAVIKELAQEVKAKGIGRIDGNVYIDASLLPDGAREGGTDVVMSSIIVNDNVIDLVCKPGARVGDPVEPSISPQTSYIHFTNNIKTGPAESKLTFGADDPASNPDGTLTIALSGNIPLGLKPQTAAVPVPSPTQFATVALREALTSAGIQIKPKKGEEAVKDFQRFQKFYQPEFQVAEHV